MEKPLQNITHKVKALVYFGFIFGHSERRSKFFHAPEGASDGPEGLSIGSLRQAATTTKGVVSPPPKEEEGRAYGTAGMFSGGPRSLLKHISSTLCSHYFYNVLFFWVF
jgi:hypothetical protein